MNRIVKSDQIRIETSENQENAFIEQSKNSKQMIENYLRDFINGSKN